ncbi:MAG: aldo/keto reductase [Clostridiales Family XIII bacterium]|jgi:predicted aldo/keto reductase-like oxidoreductase|nr:aldo/keto reductase [Clostridiales Family XIII bacterium]
MQKIYTPARVMPKTGDTLGMLGFGCMRFPRKLGSTDMDKTEKLILDAIEHGVNYFDTAYMYPGNEKTLGTILSKSDNGIKRRDRVHIATKLPLMTVKSSDDLDKFFRTSLERLETDHVEYYLVHNITGLNEWKRFEQLGGPAFLTRIQDEGAAKHIGFSYHGNLIDFREIIDAHPWEFVQIQYNYIDDNFQAGEEGLRYAAEKGLGIVVMEPLRGGTLASKLPKKAKEIIDGYADSFGVKRSAAEWALRWVWNHPEVTVALSGMNEADQLTANITTAISVVADTSDVSDVPRSDFTGKYAGALSAEDFTMIANVKEEINRATKVPCTGCSYCMPCPAGVNIPQCFGMHNSYFMFKELKYVLSYGMYTGIGSKQASNASLCKKCGQCEKKCPQHLPIMNALDETVRDMEKWYFKLPVTLAAKVLRR